jgi:hypothetical protein
MSLKRLAYIRGMNSSYSQGSFQRPTEEGEDIYQPEVQSAKGPIDSTIEFMYHDFGPVDQLILEYTKGMHGKPILSNQDLAKRLKISPGAVSQRKAKIQQQIDESIGFNLFG